MTFQPTLEQQRVIDSTRPLLVVLGGAGTGKTTTACAAARAHLERVQSGDRVLFLSFSRSSVSRILQRARGILGAWAPYVEVTTFHAIAWSLVRRFGPMLGYQNPILTPPAYRRVLGDTGTLGYNDLIPLALAVIERSEAVRRHVEHRWGLVIVDEYQDTDDAQARLITAVAAKSRRILLGDPNQCIYTFRSQDGVRPERINDAAIEAGSDGVVLLPRASHRDPSGLIPAIAEAIMRRDFGNESISEGLRTGRFVVQAGISAVDEAAKVAENVRGLIDEGHSVGIYCHHNDMLASLSDQLQGEQIDHDIGGLSDALSMSLLAQTNMVRFSEASIEWMGVLQSLSVFIASACKGERVPPLAESVLRGGTGLLAGKLEELRGSLEGASLEEVLSIAATAHSQIGLPSKANAWRQASGLLRPMAARARRNLRHRSVGALLATEAERTAAGLLTDINEDSPGQVQLLNLHQTKGREADATVVVLRSTDFFGRERPPYVNTSRLLYVVFSRARRRVVLTLVGEELPQQVAPLARLTSHESSESQL